MKTKIDCIKIQREIRSNLSKKTKSMSNNEILAFYNSKISQVKIKHRLKTSSK